MAVTTDNNATYNLEDTFENNLFKITGTFVPGKRCDSDYENVKSMSVISPEAYVTSQRECVDGRNVYEGKVTIMRGLT